MFESGEHSGQLCPGPVDTYFLGSVQRGPGGHYGAQIGWQNHREHFPEESRPGMHKESICKCVRQGGEAAAPAGV